MLSRKDANQTIITNGLKDLGYFVIDLHKVGAGVPDILVIGPDFGRKCTSALLVEIKTKSGKLNAIQKKWHGRIHDLYTDAPVIVAQDLDRILEWFGRVSGI